MTITAFDHVNVRTAQLDAMIAWYADVLNLRAGPRPDFSFPGAWLYLGDQAIIHLVGVDAPTGAPENLALEHFALRATGFQKFVDKLSEKGIEAQVSQVPGMPIVQVNVFDPDGNHIHIDFDKAET